MQNKPPTKKVKQSSGTSIATSKSSDDSNNDDATRGTKGGSQGTLSSMFGKQQASIQKDLDFVMKNAPLNRSRQLGYFVMQEHITTISAEMIAASEDGDFNLAQTKKDNLDELVKEASMEYKLYHLCTMTKEHATRKLEYHKKKLNFRECGKYQALVNVATEYLSSVPDEDVHMMSSLILEWRLLVQLPRNTSDCSSIPMVITTILSKHTWQHVY